VPNLLQLWKKNTKCTGSLGIIILLVSECWQKMLCLQRIDLQSNQSPRVKPIHQLTIHLKLLIWLHIWTAMFRFLAFNRVARTSWRSLSQLSWAGSIQEPRCSRFKKKAWWAGETSPRQFLSRVNASVKVILNLLVNKNQT